MGHYCTSCVVLQDKVPWLLQGWTLVGTGCLPFKVFVLLLVVVNGRPRGNYVQTLLSVGLLFFEFAYQVYMRPHRFLHVQYVRKALVALLLFSVFTSFFLMITKASCQKRVSKHWLPTLQQAILLSQCMSCISLAVHICLNS